MYNHVNTYRDKEDGRLSSVWLRHGNTIPSNIIESQIFKILVKRWESSLTGPFKRVAISPLLLEASPANNMTNRGLSIVSAGNTSAKVHWSEVLLTATHGWSEDS